MTEQQVDLDALEALAKAATPGPWESWNVDDETIEVRAGTALKGGRSHRTTDMIVEYDVYGFDLDEPDFVRREADADFIAATDPSTVLALIAELRQERTRADEYRDDIEYRQSVKLYAEHAEQMERERDAALTELRQERGRAEAAEDELDQALAKRISVTLRDVMDARAALSRAEATINRIDTALRASERSSMLVVAAQGIITEYAEYDKQKEADHA